MRRPCPIPQGGRLDGEHIEAVVEIFAKCLGADHGFQIPVGRRDHPHICLDGLAAPDPVELALLQHPQQLDLHRQRHIADFVEEEGAPWASSKRPRRAAMAPVKAPFS